MEVCRRRESWRHSTTAFTAAACVKQTSSPKSPCGAVLGAGLWRMSDAFETSMLSISSLLEKLPPLKSDLLTLALGLLKSAQSVERETKK